MSLCIESEIKCSGNYENYSGKKTFLPPLYGYFMKNF